MPRSNAIRMISSTDSLPALVAPLLDAAIAHLQAGIVPRYAADDQMHLAGRLRCNTPPARRIALAVIASTRRSARAGGASRSRRWIPVLDARPSARSSGARYRGTDWSNEPEAAAPSRPSKRKEFRNHHT